MLAFLVLFTVCLLAWLEDLYTRAGKREQERQRRSAYRRLVDQAVWEERRTRQWPPLQ